MTSTARSIVPAITAVLLATLMGACASTPLVDPEVEAARAQFTEARANSDAQRFANEELSHAEELLASADEAVASRADAESIDHLAYLATQTARTAVAIGEAKASEERIASAAADRERIRLAARTREAESARAAAERATAEAEQASLQASTARSELEAKQAELEELKSMNAKQSDRGIVVTLGDVLFDTDRAELKSGAARDLDNVAAFLAKNPERRVLIEGFTDSTGTDEYNLALSQRRAESVRDALVTRGVDPARVDTRGYGESFPIGTNADAGGRQLNRRVEVVVSNDDAPVEPRT
jgi:outer membrane protein OmpA-like peptidoglycan-associated protein